MVAPASVVIGSKIGGKYEVVDVIGSGGMGVVYKVREQVGAVSRIRALKTILPTQASNPAIVARFREEAEKMCLLEHENIVPVLAYSEEGEFPYLVMPFIEGQTLKEYLKSYLSEKGRPLRLTDVAEIGLQLVRALEVAHHFVNPSTGRLRPIIHRDIKPGNIMVRVEGGAGERRLKVLVMDFGIAKLKSEEESAHTLTDVIGTVKYASPEQIQRTKDIDPRADIYSLGMVLYELYTGRHVFAELTEHLVLMRMVQRHIEETHPEFPPDAPEPFRELVRRAISVDRQSRFADVAELRPLLRRILEDESRNLAAEVERIETEVRTKRARAQERNAPALAALQWAEAEQRLAEAERARKAGQPSEAMRAFESAGSLFEGAANAAVAEEQRRRLLEHLAALAPLRAAATRAGAESLAREVFDRAARATEAAARLLGASDATVVLGDQTRTLAADNLAAAVSALERAEKGWREAEARAREEGHREEARRMRETLARTLAEEAAAQNALPVSLRSAASSALDRARRALAAIEAAKAIDPEAARAALAEGRAAISEAAASRVRAAKEAIAARAEENRRARPAAEEALVRLREELGALDAAGPPAPNEAAAHARSIAEGRDAEQLASAGEFADALPRLRAATESISFVRRQMEARLERERLARRHAELAGEAGEAVRSLLALGREGDSQAGQRLLDAIAGAQKAFQAGRAPEAIAALEETLPRLRTHVVETRERLERERTRAEAERLRAHAEAVLDRARALGERASASETFVRALAGFENAAETFRGGDFPAAARSFAGAVEGLVAKVEAAERAERLAGLRVQSTALGTEFARLPDARRLRKGRRASLAALRRGDDALAAGDEDAARAAFAEATPLLERLQSEAARLKAPPARAAGFPHAYVAGGIGAAAVATAAVGFFLLRPEPEEPISRLETTPGSVNVVPTSAPELEPTAEVLAATAESAPKRTEAPAVVNVETPEPASTIQVALVPTVAPPVTEPTPTPELRLASASPDDRSLRLKLGSEQRFRATVSGGGSDQLTWELDGEPAGRGGGFNLGKEETRKPGARKVALVGEQGRRRKSLASWAIEIVPPELRFAAVEPAAAELERTLGSNVSFRAPVAGEAARDLSFSWQVNGRVARDARDSSYRLEPREPGDYRVTVRAVAPWGAALERKWRVVVKAPAPPTPALRSAEQEIRGWIQAYCSAFEEKDTAALIRLGHLRSETEAARLREALAPLADLKLSCTNPSISIRGDEATVSFDRTDRWTDRGRPLERALPRISKTLRRENGRWVAVR